VAATAVGVEELGSPVLGDLALGYLDLALSAPRCEHGGAHARERGERTAEAGGAGHAAA
jgi:hypothetical protein